MVLVLDRRGLLCDQTTPRLTGIDFVQVVDPADQTELLVFFVVEPDLVVTADGPPKVFMVDPATLPLAFGGAVTATAVGGGETAALMTPLQAEYRKVPIGGGQRIALHLKFSRPGDFSNYRLNVAHPAIDPFFNDVLFSFKQGCDTGFDCEPDCECPPAAPRDVEIDYLARDFESLNSALNDFAARYYPEWGERVTADFGVMIQELAAALGDEFSYIQDRYAREMHLPTATQRRSQMRLARLVDYVPDPGSNAACLLSLDLVDQPLTSAALVFKYGDRLAFWAIPEGKPAIPFELGDGLRDGGRLTAHAAWNAMPLHMADPGEPCLAAGATELLLAPAGANNRLPLNSQIPPGGALGGQAWVGRTMILWSRPADLGLPVRAWPVTITGVDWNVVDPLIPFSPGNPTRLTRLRWAPEQALPWALRITETRLLGNVAPARAGLTIEERFRIGPAEAAPASAAALPRAVERQGPTAGECCERSLALLYGLAGSEEQGIAHIGEHSLRSFRIPEVRLTQDAAVGTPPEWDFTPSLLSADPDDRVFTLDPGMWRPIVRYQRNGDFVVHADYAGDRGFTLRFGGGDFGREPEDGAVFTLAYRTGHGARSNVGPGAVMSVDPPVGARAPALLPVAAVRNPLAATGGVEPEGAETIRQNAPEFYRAMPLNAVRDLHFKQIAERDLAWAQRAGARTRWTGSWLRHFVTADPLDAFAYTPSQRTEFANLVDSIRMAGRDAGIRDPLYLSLDLEISFCLVPGQHPGDVRERVVEALTGTGPGKRPFFDPDNFTFGQPLRRASLEAAVQAVPGVLGVTGICLRRRGTAAWAKFEDTEVPVAMNEILRVDNDPAHPERGTLRVRVSESALGDAGCACCTP
ncbi:MAG: hypothetical protein JOZ90_04210 [Alphaproteobacteria bacterium]|nr:hypothetical protein [Alphaproteobacteria bacterium]MBV9373196.1 hypothetical protein [Alphaproteobacteria bacterium]MBV9900285.1 hypothetical protein [Alphaproteobacteria bacterium]